MKVPYIPQMEARECGAASLAMVLACHGHHAPLAEVREVCGVSRDGVTARDVVTAGEHYGLIVEGHRVAPESLGRFTRPVILHWEMNHFVVLEAWGARESRIVDPARGRRVVSAAELDRAFTGIVLDIQPGPAFARRRRERPSVGLLVETLAGAPGALVMLILAALSINILGLGLPVAIQVIVDKVLPEGRASWLTVIGWTLVGVVALRTIFTGLRARLDLLFNARFEATLSERFVRHMLRLPLPFFEQRSLGDLVGRVQSIAVVRGLLAGGAVGLVSDGLMLASAFALMLIYDVRLALVVAGAGILYLAIFLGTRPHQLRLFQTVQTESIKQSTELVQILYGLPTLKASGSEAFRQNRWTSLLVNELNARHPTFSESVGVALSVVRVTTPAIVLLWGARLVLDGEITMGVLIGFQFLQGAFLNSLSAVFGILLSAQSLPVQIERMADVLGAEPEPTGTRACPLLEGNITAEHVTFTYSRRARPALDDVSFTITSGQKVAIVGPSGSGKSTLARVLLGLQDPKDGRVLFDGLPLADLDRASVRRQMGVVLQETTLFAGTIRENLSLSHPNAPLDEVVKAARAARIHDHIQHLPDGYDTLVSATRGALSGGQRQRLALARAILHRPPIMLLDEATSALDPLTEQAIEEYLSRRRCTRIVIAHRLTTVRNADLILVLDQGRIVEQGRHHELLALGGVYAGLVARGEGMDATDDSGRRAARAAAPVTAADLAPFEMFAGLGADDLEAIAAGCQRRVVAASTRVLEPGAHGPGLLLVEAGTLSVVLEEPGLPSFELAEIGPGEPIGETGLIDGAAGTVAVVATTDCRFLLLPSAHFAELRNAADPLATRITLAAGAVAAWRLRSVAARQASLTNVRAAEDATGALAPDDASEAAAVPAALGDTAFGAAFSAPELAAVMALGETRTYEPGAILMQAGDPGHAVHVLLGGDALVTDAAGGDVRAESGHVLGGLALLDGLPLAHTVVARDRVTCFVVPYDRLAAGLDAPGRVLQIVIATVAIAAIRDLRRANLRLRERVAISRGEREQALARREREFANDDGAAVAAGPAARASLAAMTGSVPMVGALDADHSAAACVAAVLQQQGRALPASRVQEACARDAEMNAAAMQAAAAAFGLTCRQLTIDEGDLSFAREPLILESRAHRFVVAESDRRGRTQIMDPLGAATGALADDFDETYTGRCFELRPDTLTAPSVAARVRRFALSRRKWLAQVVLTILVLQVVAIGTPLIAGFIVDQVIVAGDVGRLGLAAIAFAAVIVLGAIHNGVKAAIMRFLRTQFDRDLLDQLMGHLLRLPLRFFDTNDAGSLLQRFQTFRAVRALLGGDPPVIVLELLVLNISALVLLLLQPRLAGLVIGVGVVSFLIGAICLRPLHRLVEQELDADAEQQDRLIELMRGVATLRVSGHQDGGASRWVPFLMRKLESRFRQELLGVLEYTAIDGLRVIVLAFLIWSGAGRVLDGSMSIGAFVAFYGIAGTMLGALASTASKLVPAAHVAVHLGRIRDVFEAEPEQDRAAARAPGKLRGRVAFEDVSFAYDDDAAPVIDNIRLEIEPGMKVAIVGASGAGKTTFARLLLGFYKPTAGRVLYDGRDLWGLDLTAVRRQLGVVLQDTYLFSGSVRQNVALGAPDATVDEVWDAVRLAGIETEVRALPMQLETFVAEAGGAFSGGQRQRLAIARALIRKPPIVLFDEATSALDNVSQSVVEDGLAGLSCTRIVIAHRLSTVIDADRIVVLDAGRIVEQGTHTELVALDGHYARLMRPQIADVV